MELVWFLMLLAVIAFYFIPTIVAYNEKSKNRTQVLILNIFLWWTLIGRVVALVMAVGKDK